ncbi:hypothetical protein SESBI_30260 [Sesbania bispinosa]|nr:hypothetical protein SESBI_30260 [Sesbania bispinosa]
MDEMYGVPSTAEYADKALMTPENLIFPADYHSFLMSSSAAGRIPMFGSDDLLSAEPSSAVATPAGIQRQEDDMASTVHESQNRFASSLSSPPPSLHRLSEGWGASGKIARLLEENPARKTTCARGTLCLPRAWSRSRARRVHGPPFLPSYTVSFETYCDMLVKYKSDLARPFDEATTFLNKIEMQLSHLCHRIAVSSIILELDVRSLIFVLVLFPALNYGEIKGRTSFINRCGAAIVLSGGLKNPHGA